MIRFFFCVFLFRNGEKKFLSFLFLLFATKRMRSISLSQRGMFTKNKRAEGESGRGDRARRGESGRESFRGGLKF